MATRSFNFAAYELGADLLLGITLTFLVAHLFKFVPPMFLVFWIDEGHGVCSDNGTLFGAVADQSDFGGRGRLCAVFV